MHETKRCRNQSLLVANGEYHIVDLKLWQEPIQDLVGSLVEIITPLKTKLKVQEKSL